MGIGKTTLISMQSDAPQQSSSKKYEEKAKKVQFIEPAEVVTKKGSNRNSAPGPSPQVSNNGGSNGRQIVPGLYIVSQPDGEFIYILYYITLPKASCWSFGLKN